MKYIVKHEIFFGLLRDIPIDVDYKMREIMSYIDNEFVGSNTFKNQVNIFLDYLLLKDLLNSEECDYIVNLFHGSYERNRNNLSSLIMAWEFILYKYEQLKLKQNGEV